MRASTRLVLAVALIASLAVPARSPALLYSSCSGSWTSSNQCTFFAAGTHFYLDATSSGGGVSVWVTDANGLYLFVFCSGAGSSVSCSTGEGITGSLVRLPQGVPLSCRVAGSGSGSFTCHVESD